MLTPSDAQNKCDCPSAIANTRTEIAPAPPVIEQTSPPPVLTGNIMIASDSSQTTTRTAKFRNFAMDAEQFIRDNIGLVVFVVFAILIGLALAALFTKPGKKMAAAVAG